MDLQDVYKLFPVYLPIAVDGIIWNGQPDEFSNIGCGLNWSQKFGMTPYAQTGVYGLYNGKKRPHNGLDFAGFPDTPIVMPCRGWVSYVGFDVGGYGNCCFFETEPIMRNGDTVKMEYVLAHMKELPSILPARWYDAGHAIGPMGSSGMSTGTHTHFGGRPWLRLPNGDWQYLFQDEFSQAARGYINLEPCIIEKLIYDKQILINQVNFMATNEKKIIMEAEGAGRKGIIINGKLREIKGDRDAAACLYALVNNGFGVSVKTADFDNLPKDQDF